MATVEWKDTSAVEWKNTSAAIWRQHWLNPVALAEGIELSDTDIGLAGFLAVLTEGIELSDTAAVLATFRATATDGMKLSETVLDYLVEVLTEGLVLADAKWSAWINCEDQYLTDDYTEVDPQSRLTVTTDKVEFTEVHRYNDGYVYKDFGVDYWGDFKYNFELEITQMHSTAMFFPVAMTNALGPWEDEKLNGLFVGWRKVDESNVDLWLVSGVSPTTSRIVISGSTYPLCYFTLQRVNGTVTLYMYSDANRTVEILDVFTAGPVSEELIITDTTAYRYAKAWCGYNNNFYNTVTIAGYVQNHNLCVGRSASWAKGTYRPVSTDGIEFSDTNAGRVIITAFAEDTIVFSEGETSALCTFRATAADGIVWTDQTAAAFVETLTEGMVWADGVIWIRPYDPWDIDVQPRGQSFTFKALAVLTNFKALKKQLDAGAVELMAADPIKIHPVDTDFKAVAVTTDFKATKKDFNTEV